MGSRGPITVDDVLSSRLISSPLHLLDCALDTDGGYAMVVTSAEIARNCRKPPVWIIGGSEAMHADFYATIDDPWFPATGQSVSRTAEIAFGQAGVSRDDVDVAGLYDCFTITMLRDLEELGFCKPGEGPTTSGGHTRLGGSMPCNTDGGLLSTATTACPTECTPSRWSVSCGRVRGAPGVGSQGRAVAGSGASVHGYAGTLIMAAD